MEKGKEAYQKRDKETYTETVQVISTSIQFLLNITKVRNVENENVDSVMRTLALIDECRQKLQFLLINCLLFGKKDYLTNLEKQMEELDEMASDVHSIVIKCWNPATGEFQPRGGANVISVWTKGFVESTRAPIEGLLRAQEEHFSQFSRYAQSLDDLVAFGVPHDAMLEFSATSEGWSAVTARDDVAYRCFVYSGNATQQLTDMKEHEVVCEPGASPVLREIYESLVRG